MEESNASIGTILHKYDLDVRSKCFSNRKAMFASVLDAEDGAYEYEHKGDVRKCRISQVREISGKLRFI